MPTKRHVDSCVDDVDEIIARVKSRARETVELPDKLRHAVAKFLDYNDSVLKGEKVQADIVIKYLNDNGFPCAKSKFAQVIQTNFNRSWSGR